MPLSAAAELRIIGISIQVADDEHDWEKWTNFPHEPQRLLKLIHDTKADGVLFVSGDRHFAEIWKLDGSDLRYPLYDFTASSLNQPHGRAVFVYPAAAESARRIAMRTAA